METLNIGDWGLISGSWTINNKMWQQSYPQNWFGRIISIKKRFCISTGKKLPDQIIVRCYRKGYKTHLTTINKYFIKL